MKCPFCEMEGERRELHAHMLTDHPERLETRREGERMYFDVNCPACSEGVSREVNPRGRDPLFVEKFSQEIRLVGFDLLLYHWETHAESGAGAAK
ncbi:MAG TPA: hypothetical protein VMU89_08230 [Thermomicrobiaceae bacterium]|nr:hypothetical protein [Thermomicrobiaceae bacterium]